MKHFIIFLLFISLFDGAYCQLDTSHKAIYQGRIPKPKKGIPFTDPHFKTITTRITDAKAMGKAGFFSVYSKREAWNSDESKLILTSDDGGYYLFDGNNYSFIKFLGPDRAVSGEDV